MRDSDDDERGHNDPMVIAVSEPRVDGAGATAAGSFVAEHSARHAAPCALHHTTLPHRRF